ncbi:hypothetical protein C499_05328 [Halogeometricum borinquense DSM 11551]|uniref:Uncharacterized protein n=2 Tax=Halogeometricum borinquense TaxID=60847 RepID=E4NKZ9_HALBP|nr:hypothetical protein [Halogeometricum borinquense]ADQ67151.1 hypothetical protein Hbor_15810 [Halogeometricum borinquense DSM 11551]ELY29699.1 hypothetical protein C499_05328 [Halogeometricum borinquense DSM 11551]RYJ13885.1 hypothetical protein ELS19_07835 [Halogeometricum borinquense]
MAQESLLVSFVLGVSLIAAVVVLIGRGWRNYSVAGGWTTRESGSVLTRGADSPMMWTAAFLVAALAFGTAAVLFVAGAEVPEGMAAIGGAFLVAGTTLILILYVFYGTFVSARSRGLKNAQAAFLGAWALGMLFVVAIALKLLGLF